MKIYVPVAFIASLCAVLTLTSPSQEKGVGGSTFHKNDITYSTAVETPHVKWATKLPRGPIRGFFIPSIQYGRDMVELMQRLDLAPTTVSIDRNWDTNCWGIGDYYGHEFRGDRDDFQTVYGYAQKDLTGPAPFEVLVIPGLNGWSRMTRATRDAILKRVEAGAGLVLIHPFVGDVKNHPFKGDELEGDNRIWDISPLVGCPDDFVSEGGYPEINRQALSTGKWEVARAHFITSGQSMDLLPAGVIGGSFYKYSARGDVLIKSGGHPILAVKSYGKGRVAAFAYVEEGFIPSGYNPAGSDDPESLQTTTPEAWSTGIYWNYWEYYYSLLARSIVWAAGRDSGPEIRSVTADPAEPQALTVDLATAASRKVGYEIRGRSAFGPELSPFSGTAAVEAGKATISVPEAALKPANGWPGGRVIFDVILRDPESGATLNWGNTTFEVPKPANLTGLTPATDTYRRGESLSAVVRASGDLNGLTVRFKVSDDLGRELLADSRPARPERYFYFSLQDFLGKYAYLTSELVDPRGRIFDQLRAKPVLVVQESRRRKEFNPLVSFGSFKHFYKEAAMQQVRSAAADTGFTWGGSVNNGLNIPRGAFGVYWYDRGPTTPEAMEKAVEDFNRTQDFESLQYLTRKELYRRTSDTRFLARNPSFLDNAFMQRLKSIVFAVARGKARYSMDYYFVGDEGSLTSYTDPFDFDWSEAALKAFRAWLQTRYPSLEELNRTWGSRFARWDDVLPATTEQATKSRNYAPWADHRTFMEVSFANAYRAVRDSVTAGDPEGHIAVSGTQVTTAYNGCDWYRLDQVIDDFLSYDGGNQWDLHRSFAKPGSMIGFWTGYESKGLAIQNAIWTAAIHGVLHPNIFWMLSFLNPDFTLSQGARDMGETFKALKFGGVGKLLMESERLGDGIAIHYSMPSVHAASITGNHPERGRKDIQRDFPADRDGWVRMIRDLGVQFNFVSYEQIEKGKLAGYRLLVLPMSMAISPAEAKAIRTFAEGGGIVLADAAAGLMDDHCAWADTGVLNDLFGIRTLPSRDRKLVGGSKVEQNEDGDVVGEKASPGIAGALTVTDEGKRWGLDAARLTGVQAVEAGVRADTGTALLKIGDTDAAIARPVGRGWAVYLNSFLGRYPAERRKNFGGEGYRALVRSLLTHLKVEPAVRVLGRDGAPLGQAQLVRYRSGDGELLALVKEDTRVEAVAGRDGVTVYNDSRLGKIAREEISIRLPQPLWAYDLLTGKAFGRSITIQSSITTGGVVLVGLSRQSETLSVNGPGEVRRGEPVSFLVQPSSTGSHLVRCHFFGPEGSFLPVYAQNVLVEGREGRVVLPTALNDPAGTYRLVATDLISGAEARAELVLK